MSQTCAVAQDPPLGLKTPMMVVVLGATQGPTVHVLSCGLMSRSEKTLNNPKLAPLKAGGFVSGQRRGEVWAEELAYLSKHISGHSLRERILVMLMQYTSV